MLTTLMSLHHQFLFGSHKLPLNADNVCVSVWGGEFTKRTLVGEKTRKAKAKKREKLGSLSRCCRPFWKEMFDFLWNRLCKAHCHVVVFKHSALRMPSGLGPLPMFAFFFPSSLVCLPVCLGGWRWGPGGESLWGKIVRCKENLRRRLKREGEQVGKHADIDNTGCSMLTISF